MGIKKYPDTFRARVLVSDVSMRRKFLLVITIPIVLLGLAIGLLYAGHAWWLIKYGASSQPVPSDILNVDRNFKFPPEFPPDPGPEGKKTVQGIDADHDGVRDDVQRWIYAFVPNDRKKQMALRQKTRYFQHALSDDYGLEVRKKAYEMSARSVQCMWKMFDDEMHGYTENIFLKAKVLNTFTRVSRYWSNDDKITTEEVEGLLVDYESPCDDR